MLDKEILIKRLTIIKLLHKIGYEQSNQTETTSFFSILSFHDSIEMFLKLAAEHLNIKSEKLSFIEYWDAIPNLSLKESMRNLNSRRVNLKHKGLIPAKIEIETSRVNTTDFFEQNTKTIFGVNFSEISLLELIRFIKTKELLFLAQESMQQNKIDDCIKNVTKSFYILLEEYKYSKKNWGSRTYFDFIEKVQIPNRGADGSYPQPNNQFRKVVEKINNNFEQVEKALEVITLGIDYRKYAKFKMLTPIVFRLSNNDFHMQLMEEKNWSAENCQFLIDFVLESSLKLQEFDFDHKDLRTNNHFDIEED